MKSGYQNFKQLLEKQWLIKQVKQDIKSDFLLSFLYKVITYNECVGLLLRHMEWFEAADLIVKGMEGAINNKTVTYDFERLMEGAKLLKCSEFGDAIIENM